ncbi:MAG: hypothetical protein HY902_04545 [Deltaproteobacteria bacterium]|nr:hypothetical protein [Deltaproteobacteria bacterium]
MHAAKPNPLQEAEELASRAKAEFKAGQFEQAAKDFMAAYGRSKNAALVFNAARSYEEAGKYSDAAVLFRLYLSISDDPDGMRDAQARLERLEAAAKAKPEPASNPAPPQVNPDPPPAPKPAPPPTAEPPPAPQRAVQPPAVAKAAPPPAGSSAAAWWVGVPSVLALGSGIALLAIGQSGSEDANLRTIASKADIDAYHTDYNRARSQWQVGAALTGAGTVGLGVAVWLAAHGRSGKVALVPAGHGSGVAVVGWW